MFILARRIVLARLLLPWDFGVFAFMTIVLVFASNLANLHLEDAIVQSRTDPKKMLNTAFTSQLLVSVPMFLLVLFLAGMVSDALGKSEMAPYLRVSGLVLLVAPFTLPRALFLRKLDLFKVKLPIALGMLANAVICIVMARAGLGVWALVTGYVLDAAVNMLVIWAFIPEKPKLEFDRRMLKEVLRYSLPLYLLTILVWVFWQADDFIVGIMGDRTIAAPGNVALGYYSLAFYFPHHLMKIRSELAGVSFPAFSAIRENRERLSSAYKVVTRNAAIFMLPFGAVLIPFARPTVLYLLGDKWLPAVSAFRVFMVVAIVRTVFANWGEVYKSLGKTKALLLTYLPNPILLVALGPYVTSRFGILGMSLLIMGIVLAIQPVVIYLTRRELKDVSFTRLLWKPTAVFGVVLLLSWQLSRLVESRSAFLASGVSLFLLYYLLVALVDGQFRRTAVDYVKTSFSTGTTTRADGE